MAIKVTLKKGAPSGASEEVKEEVFQWTASLYRFDIKGFDKWHSSLGECGAHKELAERRASAKDAALKNNEDALMRHLEWMLLRWKYIKREDYILPLARTGRRVVAGAIAENKQRVIEADARRNDWQARAERKWAEPQHASKGSTEIARLIAKAGENPDTIRRRIKKPS